MPFLAEITLPSGSVYKFKDEEARELISQLLNFNTWLGVTTTSLTDGATTNPITINGESVTATNGDVATYETEEFIFNGTVWQKFGDLSGLGSLAYKNSASGNFTPAGTVSKPTFTGEVMQSTGTFTPAGTITGSNVTLSKKNIGSVTDPGTLPTYTVQGERLIIAAGALPTVSEESVASDVDTITQPTFTGTAGSVSVSGTPTGNVTQPTFSGVQGTITVQ